MRFQIIAFVVFSVCVVALLNYTIDEPVKISATMELAEQNYDFFITEIDSSHFSPDGLAEYRLQASRSTHFPDPDYTILDSPNLVVYRQDEPPWLVSADTGRIEKDVALNQDKVELNGNVHIHYIDSKEQTRDFYTESLHIYPNSKQIHTDREVRIESPGATVTMVGMSADLVTNKIKWIADFKGRFYE